MCKLFVDVFSSLASAADSWPNGTMKQFSQSDALSIGKAAEHLVCADLLLSGRQAFLSDQGLPYDVLVDHQKRLFRIQVKASLSPRNINCSGKTARLGYSFSARRNGKRGVTRLSDEQCDIIAFVAIDIKVIAYLPIFDVGQTCQLMPPGFEFRGKFRRSHRSSIDGFPFERAIQRVLMGPEVIREEGGVILKESEFIEMDGRRMRISDWAKEYSVPAERIAQRLYLGWRVDDAITRKVAKSWSRKKGANLTNGSNGSLF